MKGSLLTPIQVTEHLNKCLYDTIVRKPKEIKNFDEFLKKVTTKDREVILYGLYHITYEEVRNYNVPCMTCAKEYPVTVKISDTFNYNKYPKDDILKKTVKVDLEVMKGSSITLRQPTLLDEITALKSLSNRASTEAITETLIIDSIDVPESEAKVTSYKERQDIIDAYLQLPPRDKRLIHRRFMEEFGNFGINLKMQSTCPVCGNSNDSKIDLVQQFFRLVYTS